MTKQKDLDKVIEFLNNKNLVTKEKAIEFLNNENLGLDSPEKLIRYAVTQSGFYCLDELDNICHKIRKDNE